MSETLESGHIDTMRTTTPLRLPDAASAVKGALLHALEFSAKKLGLEGPEAALERVQRGDRNAREYCHYSLAKQVSEALGALDENVKAVSMYGYDATAEDIALEEGPPQPLIHLIVWADRRTGALSSLLAALDRALVQEYAAAVGPRRLANLLDAQVVTDQDVEKRIGVAALLTSMYNPALPIWSR